MVIGISATCAKSLYLITTTSALLQRPMEKIEKWEMEGENGKQEEERDVVMAGMFLHKERHV